MFSKRCRLKPHIVNDQQRDGMMKVNHVLMIALIVGMLAGCSQQSSFLELDGKQLSFSNAAGIVYLTSFGSQDDINPPSGFEQWVLGRDAFASDSIRKPYGIAVGKGKVYINDGRDLAGYWELDLESLQLKLIRNKRLRASTGIAVDDRNYKYLATPRGLH
jgi:hypothetical protein